MQVTLGQIYKVKKGHEDKCGVYSDYDNARYIKITYIDDDLYYDILDENKEKIDYSNCFKPTDLEEISKYKVGDILVSKTDNACKILEVGETSFLLSDWNDFDSANKWYIFQEIEDCGYKLKDQEEVKPEEMTVEQVCNELGREIKIIKE